MCSSKSIASNTNDTINILSKRTLLENFQLRDSLTELKEENLVIKREVHASHDTINQQILQINKLEHMLMIFTNIEECINISMSELIPNKLNSKTKDIFESLFLDIQENLKWSCNYLWLFLNL